MLQLCWKVWADIFFLTSVNLCKPTSAFESLKDIANNSSKVLTLESNECRAKLYWSFKSVPSRKNSPIEIHRYILNVSGDKAMDVIDVYGKPVTVPTRLITFLEACTLKPLYQHFLSGLKYLNTMYVYIWYRTEMYIFRIVRLRNK